MFCSVNNMLTELTGYFCNLHVTVQYIARIYWILFRTYRPFPSIFPELNLWNFSGLSKCIHFPNTVRGLSKKKTRNLNIVYQNLLFLKLSQGKFPKVSGQFQLFSEIYWLQYLKLQVAFFELFFFQVLF